MTKPQLVTVKKPPKWNKLNFFKKLEWNKLIFLKKIHEISLTDSSLRNIINYSGTVLTFSSIRLQILCFGPTQKPFLM